jgi:metal-dependent HD superfamily phosphatase/phosphodiesterase
MSQTPAQDDRILLRHIRDNEKISVLITGANEVMKSMGYTEHGHRHAGIVAGITRAILEKAKAPERMIELGAVAAYMHDIGNVINRVGHPQHGAAMAFTLLNELGMPADEMAIVLGAIGNHEERSGTPVSLASAALIVADKSDVHMSRVQNPIMESFDIHDRVNYAVQKSRVEIDDDAQIICLRLEIDTEFASVMEYFEIFLGRMVLCRQACRTLGFQFKLAVNGVELE